MACSDPNCNTGCSCNNCCPPTPPIPTPTPPTCVGTECTELYNSSCVTYTGEAIPCLNITEGMNLTTVIQNMAIKLCDSCSSICPPQYIGYDLDIDCRNINEFGLDPVFSVDFHLVPGEILAGLPANPCISGGGGNCPLATILYSINGEPPVVITSFIWGNDGDNLSPYPLSCEVTASHLESEIDMTDYIGETVTVDYTIIYPSTPITVFTQTVTAVIPNCEV